MAISPDKIKDDYIINQPLNESYAQIKAWSTKLRFDCTSFLIDSLNRQPEKRNEYQTLVLNDRHFGNASPFSRAYYFHCSIEKRSGKIARDVSFNESHVQKVPIKRI